MELVDYWKISFQKVHHFTVGLFCLVNLLCIIISTLFAKLLYSIISTNYTQELSISSKSVEIMLLAVTDLYSHKYKQTSESIKSKTNLLPERVCRHCPVVISHTLTVESALPETRMLSLSSMPDVRDWWPIKACLQAPVSTSHTRMEVSNEPLTTWIPSNQKEQDCTFRIPMPNKVLGPKYIDRVPNILRLNTYALK